MQDTKENTKTTNEDNEVIKEIKLITTDLKTIIKIGDKIKSSENMIIWREESFSRKNI